MIQFTSPNNFNMKVIEVNRNTGLVTISVDNFKEVTIHKGRMISKTGFLSPVELSKVYKVYHAITKKS